MTTSDDQKKIRNYRTTCNILCEAQKKTHEKHKNMNVRQ